MISKQARWAWALSLVALVGVALVLAFVLALTSESLALLEQHVLTLFWANVVVASLLSLVILVAAARLVVRLRRGKFGSRLLFKLAGIFALVGVVPGVLIYFISYQFVSRSIETWFDERVQVALDAGLALGKGTLDGMVQDLGQRTREAAERLADSTAEPGPRVLERLREQLAARDVAVLGNNGQVLVAASAERKTSLAERPSLSLMRQARQLRVVSQLEGLEDDSRPGGEKLVEVRALAVIPSSSTALNAGSRYLQVTREVPPLVASNALTVQAAYSQYQQRALARDGLRRTYIGTLTLSLFLTVLGAVVLAALLGQQIAQPLLLLADGMREVARGDLSVKPVFGSRDELGGLTRSFAAMTEQLGQARSQADRSLYQLESARTRLQTILDSITAGVIVFDAQRHIDTVNPGATRILKLPLSAYRGRGLEDVPGLQEFAQGVWQRTEQYELHPEEGERDHWQDSFELRSTPEAAVQTLLVRGAPLPQGAHLVVFDDLTEVISAQRSEAWAEVARRLAHEIKNPLTPIQLSAQRLQHKLEPKLDETDQALLSRSVGTIVNQVQAMLQLVNEFRDFGRLPAAQPVPLDLNGLINEVLALYGQATEQQRLSAQCEPGLPAIMGDATQLRQVVHNLVQNSLDAVEGQEGGHVQVVTESSRDEDGRVRTVRLKVRDNGPGFADKVMKRAFEPYVTTKVKGTGLGLAVVRKISEEHGARVRIANRAELPLEAGADRAPKGAQVSISFSRLAEPVSETATAVT